MNINPTAILLWVFAALIGYILGDMRGAAIGAASAIGFSVLLDVLF